jgi:hypothetical protein
MLNLLRRLACRWLGLIDPREWDSIQKMIGRKMQERWEKELFGDKSPEELAAMLKPKFGQSNIPDSWKKGQ